MSEVQVTYKLKITEGYELDSDEPVIINPEEWYLNIYGHAVKWDDESPTHGRYFRLREAAQPERKPMNQLAEELSKVVADMDRDVMVTRDLKTFMRWVALANGTIPIQGPPDGYARTAERPGQLVRVGMTVYTHDGEEHVVKSIRKDHVAATNVRGFVFKFGLDSIFAAPPEPVTAETVLRTALMTLVEAVDRIIPLGQHPPIAQALNDARRLLAKPAAEPVFTCPQCRGHEWMMRSDRYYCATPVVACDWWGDKSAFLDACKGVMS